MHFGEHEHLGLRAERCEMVDDRARVGRRRIVHLDVPLDDRHVAAARRCRRRRRWRLRRGRRRRNRTGGHVHIIQIDPARVEEQRHLLHAGAERDGQRHRGPVLPAAGVWNRQRPGDARAVKLDVEDAALAQAGDARLEQIDAARGNIHRVIEPLAWRDPADVIYPVGRSLDVDVGRAVLATAVAGSRIVITEALAAVVEVFRLNRSGNRRRRPVKGCRDGGVRHTRAVTDGDRCAHLGRQTDTSCAHGRQASSQHRWSSPVSPKEWKVRAAANSVAWPRATKVPTLELASDQTASAQFFLGNCVRLRSARVHM